MIKLESKNFDIKISEENELYSLIKKFNGENVLITVYENEQNQVFKNEKINNTPEEINEEKITFHASELTSQINNSFSEEFLDTVSGKILFSHLDKIVGSHKKIELVEYHKEKNFTVYMKNNYFWVV